jgi:hypothetical protein
VSHAGTVLLGQVADELGLTGALSLRWRGGSSSAVVVMIRGS